MHAKDNLINILNKKVADLEHKMAGKDFEMN